MKRNQPYSALSIGLECKTRGAVLAQPEEFDSLRRLLPVIGLAHGFRTSGKAEESALMEVEEMSGAGGIEALREHGVRQGLH